MNFNWLKTNQQLRQHNTELTHTLLSIQELVDSLNATLALNIVQKEQIRNELLLLLGAAALQHNGELLIKKDFMDMFISPEYRLQVNISKEEDGSISVKTVEMPKEEENNHE
jgi:hypothetical protein